MTVTTDQKKRVTLPTRPGVRFELEAFGEDKFILTRLAPVEPRAASVTVSRKDGFSVGDTGRKINPSALKEALAEFP